MGTDAPTTIFILVHCAPKKAPCPKCGKLKRNCTREVRTVAYKAIAYLRITPGARQLVRDEGEDVQDRGSGFLRDSGTGWRSSPPHR